LTVLVDAEQYAIRLKGGTDVFEGLLESLEVDPYGSGGVIGHRVESNDLTGGTFPILGEARNHGSPGYIRPEITQALVEA
jgi:hypothetical protein